MREHDPNNSVDSRIDAALRAYADPPQIPDPRTVALRLLEREAQPRPQWPLWRWAIPACLVALAVAAAYLLRTPPAPQVAHSPAPPKILAQTKAPTPPVRHVLIPAAHRRSARVLTAKSQPLPRLAVFPTPTPLSPQEQALVAFAKYGPPAVQRAVIQEQKHWDDPITVAGLQNSQPETANQQDQ
jgi:hypothetical protein